MLTKWLIWARDHHAGIKKLFFGALGLLVAVNFLIRPHEPHFGLEKICGFWAAFGVLAGVVFVVVLKKIVFPLLGKSEDFYDRGI